MNLAVLGVIVLILVPLAYFLITDYLRGLFISAALLVSLGRYLVIPLPGGLPNLTIQRLILILLIIVWWHGHKSKRRFDEIPFIGLLVFLGLVNTMSLINGIAFTEGLKDYLSFTIETCLFYIIVITSIDSKNEATRILKYVIYGLVMVAFFAFIEKYTHFNIIELVIPGHKSARPYPNDIISTYPHRILLGTAMSMGWPLALVLMKRKGESGWETTFLIMSVMLFFGSVYFSQSRGPWLASILAGVCLFFLSSSRTKRKLVVIFGMAAFILLLRPGVWHSIERKGEQTLDSTTMKGGTYQYRWELWGVAYSEIIKAPDRTLFGYGPRSTGVMNIYRTFSYSERGRVIWSWDNQYAYHLITIGILGLGAVLLLHIVIIIRLFKWLIGFKGFNRDVLAGVLTSILMLFFMMTNVSIFAPQLDYLLWILVAVGITFGTFSQASVIKEKTETADNFQETDGTINSRLDAPEKTPELL